MKKTHALFICIMFVIGTAVVPAQTDITSPGDPVVGVPGDRWPAGEAPAMTIDDDITTKYLNFRAAQSEGGVPVGFRVTPSRSQTIAGGMTFTSANDSQGRDPIHYQLYGSNEGIDGPYTMIAEGDIVDFINGVGRRVKTTTPIRFVNTVAYDHYQVLFTAIRDINQNSMQVAEVEILEMPATGWAPEVYVAATALLRLPNNTLELTGTISDSDSAIEDMTIQWSKLSGPGTVDFGGTEAQVDATAEFSADPGIYELILQVTDDMGNDANDVIMVRVWDSATEDALTGYWAFNDGPGTMTAADSSGANDGILAHHATGGGDPNWMTGWIPGDAPTNFALDFTDLGFVKVDPNGLNDDLDPQWSITIAAWVRAVNWDGNHRVLQKGLSDNQYRLLCENDNFVFHLSGVGRLETDLPPAGLWHHVAGTYDGSMMKIYIDGVEKATMEADGLINTTEDALYIGTKSEFVDPVAYPNDYLRGSLDDVRIYNYALTADELIDLVVMGENAAPSVSIADPEELVLSVENFIDLDATVIDVNGDEVTKKWTMETGPADVTFEPGDSVEDARVVFTEVGTYLLRLTISDDMFGLNGEIYDEVIAVVTNPTCAEVIAMGYGLFGDYDNDCDVDFVDFAEFAKNWLKCVDPFIPECDNPFQQ